MRIGVAILTRLNSNRLPRKALLDLAGKPLLGHVIDSTRLAANDCQVVVATSREASDDPIAEFCSQRKIECFRGDLENVAQRFADCARNFGWTYAVRINGDNLFLDVEAFKKLLQLTRTQTYDFLTNVPGRTFPYGMSIEIIRTDFYLDNLPSMNSQAYREHVTLWLYENEDVGKRFLLKNDSCPQAAGLPLAVDTKGDLDRSQFMVEKAGSRFGKLNMAEIVDLYKQWQSLQEMGSRP